MHICVEARGHLRILFFRPLSALHLETGSLTGTWIRINLTD